MDGWLDLNPDPVHVKREREKARGNCVPCCKDCNSKKKAYTPAEQILNQLFPGGDPS